MTSKNATAQIAFDYIKSPQFRVIRADGAIGSVTPSGQIHFALFSERQAIPRRIVQHVSADGTLGEIVDEATESRNSIVREMDVDIFLTLDVAETLQKWLSDKIREARAAAPKSRG